MESTTTAKNVRPNFKKKVIIIRNVVYKKCLLALFSFQTCMQYISVADILNLISLINQIN